MVGFCWIGFQYAILYAQRYAAFFLLAIATKYVEILSFRKTETQQNCRRNSVEECIFGFLALHIECRFNKNSLLRRCWVVGISMFLTVSLLRFFCIFFFKIYKGYVDDPRNTDNAWMETCAVNFHDETGESLSRVPLKAGDDACAVRWLPIDRALLLYASHAEFVEKVCRYHGAYFAWVSMKSFVRWELSYSSSKHSIVGTINKELHFGGNLIS